jgi:ubiquitin-conjugating enzyme E2 Q
MGFKKFRADVSTAAQKVAGGAISGVLALTNGDSDGEVVLRYHHDSLPGDIHIQALAQDVNEYPDGNMFMVWTDEPDPPPPVVAAIKVVQDYLSGMSVYEMVVELASRLEKEIARVVDGEDGSEDDTDDESEDEDDYDASCDADYPSDGDEFGLPSSAPRLFRQRTKLAETPKPLLQRIRRDLRQVKQAGYKVGFLDAFGKTAATGIISVSIRVDKLALSDGAMEAWDVKPTDYLVLLLRFQKTYDPLERVIAQAASHTEVTFRIGKCNKYKPSLLQALGVFAESNRVTGPVESETMARDAARLEKLFVSNSLDSFLNESFISLLKIRETSGLDWDQANDFLRTTIGLCAEAQRLPDPPSGTSALRTSQDTDPAAARHHVLGRDHLLEKGPTNERSLPLVAMQFAMRYFVKCTEYCLRCHRRLEKGFEALRPYVCPDPLCLFQYMAMGFGPAVEHEILTEPYVVDLLVSLCYAAIQPYNHWGYGISTTPQTELKLPIRSLPVGLRLRVPDLSNLTATPLKAKVAADKSRIVFDDEGAQGFMDRLAPNQWLAFRTPGETRAWHARVQEVSSAMKTAFIEVVGESAAYWSMAPQARDAVYGVKSDPIQAPPTFPEMSIADVYPYDADFDSMDDSSKGIAMRHILDTLPSILEIGDWLSSHPHSTLRSMNCISPAAASLLQWIVSSNRSCIFQVDRSRPVPQQQKEGSESKTPGSKTLDTLPQDVPGVAGRGRNREHERILGMDGWIQFRFAQGSPDKELRFNRALQEVAARKPIHSNPTIFAWHGSNLANWHSIVRTGLDYKDIRCGRAYGHGVYFSPHQSTSIGYSANGGQQPWPNSDLHITTCLSLNEIINAPDEFVSRSPHYVVSQLDWHQCRYLFVQATGKVSLNGAAKRPKDQQAVSERKKLTFYPQAPGLEVVGQSGKPLQIPLSAIPVRTIGPAAGTSSSPAKRAMRPLDESDEEDAEDVSILFTDYEDDAVDGPPRKKPTSRASSMDMAVTQEDTYVPSLPPYPTTSLNNLRSGVAGPLTPASINIDRAMTDFEPGSLDLSSLPRLQSPSFATTTASKALGREIFRLQSLQSKTPLHELGWYMDFDSVNNLYQWIVQLHSFDRSLPLAQDMKKAGVTSIVLELRFGPEYPFAPPFVRVVRPRFLPFMDGGGGHVTAGGAMCMDLLTSSGWSPVSSMESVFLQVRMAMCSLEPKPARLDRRVLMGKKEDYSVAEAIEAFERAAKAHGWEVPPGLRVTANGV